MRLHKYDKYITTVLTTNSYNNNSSTYDSPITHHAVGLTFQKQVEYLGLNMFNKYVLV